MQADREKLVSVLETAELPPQLLADDAGNSVLVLPHGGRILGLFSASDNTNFLWTNPRLGSADTARELFASDQWHNSGGDRTWLGPELDFFFPDYPDTAVYFQPRQLDPGNYKVVADTSHITLENNLTIRSARHAEYMSLRITKRVQLVRNPLRYGLEGQGLGQLQFAGYRLESTLELLNPQQTRAHVNIWNLLQLPNGGEMFVPTYYRSEPTVFFGVIPPGDLRAEERLVRYKMNAPGEQKISVRALATTGRAGYWYEESDTSVLIVRNFSVHPSGEYTDVWHTLPNDKGYSFQACNINSQWGSFSEMEYHMPDLGGDTGHSRQSDVSEVWAFRGTHGHIERAAGILLTALD